ncbi:major facilitator superfamily transporter [Alcanivorax xiamenensis]|uniref:Major facilitator superfamily transporter n=1 Tax=Alcanivorax xiamenensis TaxID=1177156 RepID=A0ABQ6YD13_9GAMM|nr:RhtX/FptX family siderophore transporter [Alcanivorax xiamenensis]KAF0807702.1 major facilitator superfamily transporter [Alcanivorax xiamenensis]
MFELFQYRWRILPLVFLYLSQGIPIGVAMDALPTLLRHDGAPLPALAFLPLVGLPWVVKFLWAPVVDNHWSDLLGRRRSWILPMQTIVLACLLALAIHGISLATAGSAVALLALASLASATQDIATDGMAAEQFQGTLLAKVNAIQVGGVMVGFFAGGAGSLILSGHFGQTAAFMVLSLIPLLSLLSLLFAGDTTPVPPRAVDTRASLPRFLRRPLAPSLLALALLSAMTSVSGFGLSKLYLTDAGWSLEAVGRLGMGSGVITVLLGCGGGAWLARSLGAWRAFAVGVVLAAVSALLWLIQAASESPPSVTGAWISVAFGALATGITSVSIFTAAMGFAGTGQQAGTDVTAVQSTRDLGELLSSSLLITVTASIGYRGGFLGGMLIALIALALVWKSGRTATSAGNTDVRPT